MAISEAMRNIMSVVGIDASESNEEEWDDDNTYHGQSSTKMTRKRSVMIKVYVAASAIETSFVVVFAMNRVSLFQRYDMHA